MALGNGSLRFWLAVLGIAVTILVGFETILLSLSTGYFTGGFQSPHIDSLGAGLAYFGSAVVFDAALIALSWTLLLPFVGRLRGGPLRCASIAILIGIVPAGFFGLVQYQVHVVMGEMIRLTLLGTGSAGSSTSSLAMIGEFVPPAHVSVLLACGLGALAIPFVARHLDARQGAPLVPAPPIRRLGRLAFFATLASAAIFTYALRANETLHYGLSVKSSARALEALVQAATDWDRDGYGLLSRPRDFAPLNGDYHPYALDVPGNGIDENGLGGDHPAGGPSVGVEPSPVAGPAANARPHLLLIFLETFRADTLDARIDGRRVTPFLDQLAREGARSDRMFVHSPWTLTSRDSLFRGTVAAGADPSTLIEDLRKRGYAIAHFSGQDDSYGRSDERLGFLDATRFYDAREDVRKRTTRSTASVSLQVSWKTLLSRVDAFLDDYTSEASADADKPLFLYVNLVDTHFPYTHAEVDEIVADPRLSRREIRGSNAERVYRTYLNTAANVDRAIERLVGRYRAAFAGEPQAIVVTGDHGESFYESRTLGHGQTLRSLETRVPLIVTGIGGTWPEPVAMSDLRHLITANLGVETGDVHPRFEIDPQRRVFQHLGPLEKVERIAMRGARAVDVLDVRTGERWRLDAREERLAEAPTPEAIQELIWTWEALQNAQCTASPDRGPDVDGKCRAY